MKLKTLIIILLLASSVRAAEQQSRQVEITLELASTCVLNVNNVQGFGAWSTGNENISGVALGSISVTCADGLPYAVGIDAGENYNGSRRRLKSDEGNYVPYLLRANSSSGPEWGDTGLTGFDATHSPTHPALAVQGTGTGAAQTLSVWGEAKPCGAAAGTYADRVNITLVW